MTVGYLHVGDGSHGVTRYGHLLAAAARQDEKVRAMEAEVQFADESADSYERLRAASGLLQEADVVHLQFNADVWGGPRYALAHLAAWKRYCTAPWVVTVHDVRSGYGAGDIVADLWRQKEAPGARTRGTGEDDPTVIDLSSIAKSTSRAARYLRDEARNALTTRWLVHHAERIVVCSHEEARRIRTLPRSHDALVIPHMVERRAAPGPKDSLKRRLGLAGKQVLTILGYIHRRKGHDLLVEALPLLPDSAVAIFAGGSRDERYLRQVTARADDLGVSDRLRITGYLDEESLNRYLFATDLAICPYRRVSASGSLSSWFAAGTPVIASDRPLMREYNKLSPGAVHLMPSLTPQSIASSVEQVFTSGLPEQACAPVQVIQELLSPEAMIARHREVYAAVSTYDGGW